jgi:hypothetical protein
MRYKKALLPNELHDVYHPAQQFSITLPRKKLDLSSFTLYYDGNAAVDKHIIKYTLNRRLTFPTQTAGATPGSVVNGGTGTIGITGHGLGATDTLHHVIYLTNGNPEIPNLVNNGMYILKVNTGNSVFVLPTSTAVDIDDTNIIPIGTTATGNHTFEILDRKFESVPRQFPRLSSCVISEMMVSVDNKVQCHLKEYNTLSAILNDIRNDKDDLNSDTSDSIQKITLSNTGVLEKSSKLFSYERASGNIVGKYSDNNKNSYFINKWLGFLGESSRFFDATHKEVKITFKLEKPNILYKGIGQGYKIFTQTLSQLNLTPYEFKTDYELYNIKATIDVVDEMPVVSDFVFRDYDVQLGSYVAHNKKSMTQMSLSKPVEYLLGTFKKTDYMTSDTELQLMRCNTDARFGSVLNNTIQEDAEYSYEIAYLHKEPYLLNSSYWFSHSGDGISHCSYKWNNYDLTPQMDLISCYNETRKCFNTDYKKAASIQSFEADFFVNAIRVDDNSNEYKQISWEVEIDNRKSNTTGGQPMLFVCYMNNL